MSVRKIKKSWWIDFRTGYMRYRKRSPENTKAGAEAYEAHLRQKLARGEPIDRVWRVAEQEQTFASFAVKWFDEYVIPNNKFSEQRTKKYTLSGSLIPFFGKKLIKQITSRDIAQYVACQSRTGLKNKTINNHLTVLKKCLTTAYEWLELPGAPPKVTWLKCSPPNTEYLSPDECALLLSHADGVVRELILTALRTGMRQGELKGLQWSSIDWQNQNITVRHSRSDYTKQLDSPKSNRERHIPIDIDVYTMLFNRKQDTGYVFMDVDNHVFDEQRLRLRLKNVCKKAGLCKKIGWHTLRHTFASHLVMAGVPLTAVKELMGHSSIMTTMRYAHLAPSTLRAAIDMLNPKTMLGESFGQPVGNRWYQMQQNEMIVKRAAEENPYLST